MGLSQYERMMLIQGAHGSVRDFLEKGVTNGASTNITDLPPALQNVRSVFVTIYNQGRLRGSMGITTDLLPLWQACLTCARNAAHKDPRFLPVTLEELPHITFEITLMDEARPFTDTCQIRSGDCGLILQKGPRREVFMPKMLKDVPGDKEETMSYLRDMVAIDAEGTDVPEEWTVFKAEIFTEDDL